MVYGHVKRNYVMCCWCGRSAFHIYIYKGLTNFSVLEHRWDYIDNIVVVSV